MKQGWKGIVAIVVLLAAVAAPGAALASSPVPAGLSLEGFTPPLPPPDEGDGEPLEGAEDEAAPVPVRLPAAWANPTLPAPVRALQESPMGQPLFPFVANHQVDYSDRLEGYDLPNVIGVDVTNQVVTIVERDENGQYSVPVKLFPCSTGTGGGNATPQGAFFLPDEYLPEWVFFPTFEVYVRYAVRIRGDVFFHSLLYPRRSLSARTTASLRALGTRASHGCIRMMDSDIQWLHQNVRRGTLVLIYEGPPDPALNATLRPAAQKALL